MARRPQQEEHENHERWMVSYADFVTLLFAFFVVMYAISSVNAGKYKQLSDSLMSAFRDGSPAPTRLQQSGQPANTMIAVEEPKTIAQQVKSNTAMAQKERVAQLAKNLLKALEPLGKTGQVRITHSKRGIAIEINDTALFVSGQAQPSAEAVRVMGEVAHILATVDHPVRVEGFSDNVPIKTATYPSNWELSAARAGSIVRLFQESGVPASRLTAIGRAENQAIASNDTAEGRARNHRAHRKPG